MTGKPERPRFLEKFAQTLTAIIGLLHFARSFEAFEQCSGWHEYAATEDPFHHPRRERPAKEPPSGSDRAEVMPRSGHAPRRPYDRFASVASGVAPALIAVRGGPMHRVRARQGLCRQRRRGLP